MSRFHSRKTLLALAAGLFPLGAVLAAPADAPSAVRMQKLGAAAWQDGVVAEGASACPLDSYEFSSGGATPFFHYCVGINGTIAGIDIAGARQTVQESYVLCSDQSATGANLAFSGGPDGSSSGFQSTTRSQPNGPGTTPLTITAKTADGKLQVTQKYTHTLLSQNIVVNMTVKNLTNSPLTNVKLARVVDLDIGDVSNNWFGTGARTAFAWNVHGSILELTATTTHLVASTTHDAVAAFQANNRFVNCEDAAGTAPSSSPVDHAVKIVYAIGTLAGKASDTAQFVYQGK